MRFLISTVITCVIALSITGCAEDKTATMPDLVGKRLDIALSDVQRAGLDDDVEVLGGGMFGVVDESKWTVCTQEPTSGSQVSTAPRVTVERSCEDTSPPKGDAEDAAVEDAADDQQAAAPTKPKKKHKRPPAEVRDTFVMPALVGANLQDAQDALQARGSFLLTQTDGTGLGRFQMLDSNWRVCAQDPRAGTTTSLATLVELVAVKLAEPC
jgi:beta-lactam-binding protein with PASTA domain